MTADDIKLAALILEIAELLGVLGRRWAGGPMRYVSSHTASSHAPRSTASFAH